MAMVQKSTTSKDQEKYLVAKLLERSYNKLVMNAVCDNLPMKEGAGDTAYMVRYKRMNVPVETLTEGVTPDASMIELEEVTVQLDQWGDYLILTDVVHLTTKHPLLQEARKLLADNAARVLDREITLVMLAGTNIQYFDGTVAARSSIIASNIINNDVVGKANVTLTRAGASPMGVNREDSKENEGSNYNGEMTYIAIVGPEVKQDILRPNVNFGTFIQNNVYNQKGTGVTVGAIGKWCGCLWIETNFIPVFTLFGNKVAAAVAGAAPNGLTGVTFSQGAGGSLANGTTYGWKIVRRSKLRGFPENISRYHTTVNGQASGRFTFVFDSNYYYDVYFGITPFADSDLKLAGAGLTGETLNIDAVPTSTVTAPANIAIADTADDASAVHPVFIVGENAMAWCGFYKPRFLVSPEGPTNVDPLAQRRTVGFKFYGKSVIKNNDFMLRLELASSFAYTFS